MDKTCRDCGYSITNNSTGEFCKQNCDTYDMWQPVEPEKPSEKEERDHKAHIGLLNSRLQEQKEMYQKALDEKEAYIQRLIDKPKLKEQKMKIGIFKFTVRRYVMACTLIVTAKIAIMLNPKLFWLLGLLGATTGEEGNPINPKDPLQIAMAWLLLIVTCFMVVAAIYAYNKATAWLFGESK